MDRRPGDRAVLKRAPYDVVVAGAGPAGSMAAIHLARAGHRVALLDRSRFPRDKSCGDGLVPRAVDLLTEAGLGDVLAGARIMDGVCLHARSAVHGGSGRPTESGAGGVTLARREFDALLVERAVAAGAELRERAEIVDLDRAPGGARRVLARTDRGADWIETRFVVGADGGRSLVARRAGLFRASGAMLGVARRGYFRSASPLVPAFHIHVPLPLGALDRRFAGYGWAFPVAGDLINVGVGLYPAGRPTRFPSLVQLFDGFVAALAAAHGMADLDPCGRPIGGLLASGCDPARCHGEGVVLVGDAAGLVDPFTGEGIHPALRSGTLAAEVLDGALRSGGADLGAYGPRLAGMFSRRMRQGAAFLRGYPAISRAIVCAIDRDARFFAGLRRAAFGLDTGPGAEAPAAYRACFRDIPAIGGDPVDRVQRRLREVLSELNYLLPKIAGTLSDPAAVEARLAMALACHFAAGGRAGRETVEALVAVELCVLAFEAQNAVGDLGSEAESRHPDPADSCVLMVSDGMLTQAHLILSGMAPEIQWRVSDVAASYAMHWLELLRRSGAGTLGPRALLDLRAKTSGALHALSAELGMMTAGATPPGLADLARTAATQLALAVGLEGDAAEQGNDSQHPPSYPALLAETCPPALARARAAARAAAIRADLLTLCARAEVPPTARDLIGRVIAAGGPGAGAAARETGATA